jgi:small acid-soluble spore protein D (minor alpha/beta-type SASP)
VAKRRRRLLVPEAAQQVNRFKAEVMAQKGYNVSSNSPELVKYEFAKQLDVPLKKGYNGTLTSKQAGQVGGEIGGLMVKEMIKLAKSNLEK